MEFLGNSTKKYRKRAETYATFKKSGDKVDAPWWGTGNIPIPSFDTDIIPFSLLIIVYI